MADAFCCYFPVFFDSNVKRFPFFASFTKFPTNRELDFPLFSPNAYFRDFVLFYYVQSHIQSHYVFMFLSVVLSFGCFITGDGYSLPLYHPMGKIKDIFFDRTLLSIQDYCGKTKSTLTNQH